MRMEPIGETSWGSPGPRCLIGNVGPHCFIWRERWCQTQPWIEINPRKVLWECVFRNQEERKRLLSRCCVQTLSQVLYVRHYPTCPVRPHMGRWWKMRLSGRKVKASGNSGPEPDRTFPAAILPDALYTVCDLSLSPKTEPATRSEQPRVPENSFLANRVFTINTI